jgi:drug/metabolite transporter (DMT)-like permease
MLRVFGLGTWYIFVSGSLIYFNKFLMNTKRFPHAMALTCIHMCMTLFLCLVTYCVRPSMFPGVERTQGKRLRVLNMILPIGVLFAIMLYGSNRAYLYCGIAFLQFMKEANVALVFIFSCAAGLQTMSRQRLFVICWIILGSSICVHGDMSFFLIGFALQAMSQLAECMRAVLAEMLLSGDDVKLDPLTYTMFMSPVCLGVLLLGTIITWTPAVLEDFLVWWPYLLPNASLAFVLNLSIAALIQNASAVGFILCGVLKDICLVVGSVFILGESIVALQWFSFTITISGVFVWSYMRVCPDAPAVQMFERALCVEKAEVAPLLAKKV